MGNRIFTGVVLMLWASSMSWLFVARILPSFLQGEPPSQGSLEQQDIVCWRISCNDQDRFVGWAISKAVPGVYHTTELHSYVRLERIPLKEMTPQWMTALIDTVGDIELEMRNRVTLDSLGQISAFDSKVFLNQLLTLKMLGRVKGSDLEIQVESDTIKHEVVYPAPKQSMLAGELTPDARLMQAYVGRKWQREVYSPFRSPTRSVEILQAEVVEEEKLFFAGKLTPVKRIEYRTLSSAGMSTEDSLRANLWVADDGTVLRQDIYLMNVTLHFERKLDEDSRILAAEMLDLDSYATAINPHL